jgi:ubiquinone/menaquinone biosynthesis C-methylase UbiE
MAQPPPHIERFDNWAGTYEHGFMWRHFFQPVHERVLEALAEVDGKHVLDLGCGTGSLALRLWERGARVTGIDASEGMLEIAEERARGREGLVFLRASLPELPLSDETFDIVVSSIAFHHFPSAPETLSRIHRVLKPGGRLLICDLCHERFADRLFLIYGRAVGHDTFYWSRESLSRLLTEAGFSVEGAAIIRRFPRVMLVKAAA